MQFSKEKADLDTFKSVLKCSLFSQWTERKNRFGQLDAVVRLLRDRIHSSDNVEHLLEWRFIMKKKHINVLRLKADFVVKHFSVAG